MDVCDMTHPYVWRDSFICVTHWHVRHGTLTCVTWLKVKRDEESQKRWRKSKESPFSLRLCATWLIHACDVTQFYVCHDSLICVTHSHVWHDSLICATWLIPDKGSQRRRYSAFTCVWHDSFVCVTWLIRMRDSFTRVTWRIDMCDKTDRYQINKPKEMKKVKRDEESQKRRHSAYACVWHDSFMCVTWLIHVCDVTHSCVWRDSFMCVTWLIHACAVTPSCLWRNILTPHRGSQWRIQPPAHVSDMIFSCEWHDFWGYACVRHTHEQIRHTYEYMRDTRTTHIYTNVPPIYVHDKCDMPP